jgi:hypothetical protein
VALALGRAESLGLKTVTDFNPTKPEPVPEPEPEPPLNRVEAGFQALTPRDQDEAMERFWKIISPHQRSRFLRYVPTRIDHGEPLATWDEPEPKVKPQPAIALKRPEPKVEEPKLVKAREETIEAFQKVGDIGLGIYQMNKMRIDDDVVDAYIAEGRLEEFDNGGRRVRIVAQ